MGPCRRGSGRDGCGTRGDQVEFQECSLDECFPRSMKHGSFGPTWRPRPGGTVSADQAVEGGPGQAPADPRILLACGVRHCVVSGRWIRALFDRGTPEERTGAGALPPRIGHRRLRHAVRNQVEFQTCSLDELLPEEHEARIVWDYVCGLDLTELHERIQAVEGGPGQAPADPRILVALWLYATLRGGGQRAGTESLVRVPCGVSLALRRRFDELPHPFRLSHAARGTARPPADRRASPA